MKLQTIRFDEKDFKVVEEAAEREGLDISPFVRRCTLLYIREKYPDLVKAKPEN